MSLLTIDRKGPVAVVTLRRPPANAMSIELTEQIARDFEAIAADDGVRSVVLTGEGRSFCAGLDLKSVPGFCDESQRRLLDALNRAFLAVYDAPVPVVGAINGHAIAGGLVLALCCDWRMAANTGFQAGLTEVRVGIPYPTAAIEVVRAELSAAMARELVLFGRNIPQERATRDGVFDEAVEPSELLESAVRKATVLAELPRIGFVKIKRQLRRASRERILAALAGEEPLYGDWLSEETIAAAAAVLGGRN